MKRPPVMPMTQKQWDVEVRLVEVKTTVAQLRRAVADGEVGLRGWNHAYRSTITDERPAL